MITRAEILMGRDKEYPLSMQLEANLVALLSRINKFRLHYGKPMYVSSGYRPGGYNKAAGGAVGSLHITCQAVDFKDTDDQLAQFCLTNQKLLKECELWIEDPISTPGWVHMQTKAPKSGNRVFRP